MANITAPSRAEPVDEHGAFPRCPSIEAPRLHLKHKRTPIVAPRWAFALSTIGEELGQ